MLQTAQENSEGAQQSASESAAAPMEIATAPPELPTWTPEPVVQAWELVQAQPLIGAVALIVVALIIGKLAELIMKRFLTRLTAKTETDLDDRLIELLQRPVFLTVFLLGLALATRILGLPEGLTRLTVKLLYTIIVLVWLGAGLKVTRLILDALARNRRRFRVVEERTIPLFEIILKLALLGGASYLILKIWGIDATAWLASAGVLGLAVGFAAKDTLANLFGGFFIVADAPYKLGDFVVLDSGERGMVTQVGIRSTRLLTRDDVEITIPNAVIANAKIINESGGPHLKERIRIRIGVAYGSDLDRVCEVLEEIARGHEEICNDPAPRVRFRNFGDSSLDLELLCWIEEPVLRGKLTHELNLDVYRVFMKEGIEIPFPQRDVHLYPAAAGSDTAR